MKKPPPLTPAQKAQILGDDKRKPLDVAANRKHILPSADPFFGWPSTFGRYLVFVDVYTDDSGTHDAADVQTLSGFVADRATWVKFSYRWRKTLKDFSFRGPYFHYTAWTFAFNCAEHGEVPHRLKSSPYYGWTVKTLLQFRLALAQVAAEGSKFPICGGINVPLSNDRHKDVLEGFFESLNKELDINLPDYKQPNSMTVFFDQNSDPRWITRIKSASMAAQAVDVRLRPASFADMSKDPPMQAADLLAGRCREIGENYRDTHKTSDHPYNVEFDRVLFRSVRRSASIQVRRVPSR